MNDIKSILKKRYGNSGEDIVLHGADYVSQKGYTNIPNYVLYATTIGSHAKLVYAMLLSYAWRNNAAFPGQERLGRDCGISARTVFAALKELDDQGFISIIRRGQGRTNLYVLNFRRK